MTLRTPNPMNSSQSLLDLQRSKERHGILATQLSSGKRIVNVGDDPTGAALIMDFQASINRNNQYIAQIANATNLLEGTETALNSVNSTLTRLLELGQQGMSESGGASARSAISNEVKTLGIDLVSTGNTKQQGKYLFGGTCTTTLPFSGVVPANPNPPPPQDPLTQTVGYNGDGNAINVDISVSASVTTNLPGNTVFYGPGGPGSSTDIFATVEELRAGLVTNDTDRITAACENLQTISSRVNDLLTEVGGRQAGMQTLKEGMNSYNASLNAIQGGLESVDFPEAITAFNKENTAQQATLSVMGKSSSKSLFDYLA